MSTRKPKPTPEYPNDLLTERLQLITVEPPKDRARAPWPAEMSAAPEHALRPRNVRLH